MLLPVDSPDPVYTRKFQQLVGALMWLCRIRFDLLFCVNLFARSLQCATKQHFDLAAGRPLRNLKKTTSLGVVLQGGLWTLGDYGDADLAGDLRTARSTSGYFLRIGSAWWFDMRQQQARAKDFHFYWSGRDICIGVSRQMSDKEVVWVRLFAWDLGFPFPGPTPVFTGTVLTMTV